ncbi:MAG: sulfatase-like hydrolase/transferase, partial [bacterium]|nr:sulfatase-like hydrolase/transferase [bacterium]
TGTSPRGHGDRVFQERLPMPELPTVAQTFRDAGFQAFAVGKLHVYPQRDRIGFDDVILDEEGRAIYGVLDDYEIFLGDQGYPGRHFDHGMSNNQYGTRPWHLPEETHATNWATQQMVRTIKRRDPTRPAFWYLAYRHPHPPLVPLKTYWDLYGDIDLDEPAVGAWAANPDRLPYSLQASRARCAHLGAAEIRAARRAFYALSTHIDHQLRVVIGSLREEGLLDDTVICFSSDHGDMLGNHGMWAKRLFYEPSANVPMILVGARSDRRVGFHRVDDRLVGWQDVMPTLLDLAGVEIPDTVEGISMVGKKKRDHLYGEVGEDGHATRMIYDGRFKLIYYPVGHWRQLFDTREDPSEVNDLSGAGAHAETLDRLTDLLIGELYGGDEQWVRDGRLVGLPDRTFVPGPNKGLSSQRGQHWPPPPKTDMRQIEWHAEAEEEKKG